MPLYNKYYIINMEPELLQKLWKVANRPNPNINDVIGSAVVQKSIRKFLKYTSKMMKDLNLKDLYEKDFPVIREKSAEYTDWKIYSILLSPSGVIYMKMSDLFTEINSHFQDHHKCTFIFKINHLQLKVRNELLDNRIYENFKKYGQKLDRENMSKYRIVFERYWMALTSMGNIEAFPLIEEIYKLSRKYVLPDDWQIVKYLPSEYRPDDDNIPKLTIYTLGNSIIDQDSLKYELDKGKLLVAHSGDIDASSCIKMATDMNVLFGEYCFAKTITNFKLAPLEVAGTELRPMNDFYKEVVDEFTKNTKLCAFCSLRDCNVEFCNINHNRFNENNEDYLPEGDYCSYCIGCVDRLFMGKE